MADDSLDAQLRRTAAIVAALAETANAHDARLAQIDALHADHQARMAVLETIVARLDATVERLDRLIARVFRDSDNGGPRP